MCNEDLRPYVSNERQQKKLRERLTDEFMAALTDDDLVGIRETVASEREKAWSPLGSMIRRCDPRLSPDVRARVFEMIPVDFLSSVGVG